MVVIYGDSDNRKVKNFLHEKTSDAEIQPFSAHGNPFHAPPVEGGAGSNSSSGGGGGSGGFHLPGVPVLPLPLPIPAVPVGG